MPKIRVLVVDDAVVIRKILTDVISADSELEVVGTAPNGKIALQKIAQLSPDVVTLDVEMPEMNGIETLRHLRKDYPKLPVIMFSTLTEKGACATLDALAAGATDYVTKPANVGNVTMSREKVQQDLIRKIKSLGVNVLPKLPKPSVSQATSLGAVEAPLGVRMAVPNRADIRCVAIGVSTGGPNALATIIPALPEDLPVPIVIVQHMPPMFTRLLAERLNAQTKLTVVEAGVGQKLTAGTIYIAPGDYHMETLKSGAGAIVHLHQGPQENSCRPAVDVLFRAVAHVYGKHALGIILTGMGHDGLRGCELLKEAGAQIIAQDKATSVVWGMPSYIVEANLADAVVPLSQVAHEISRRVMGNARSFESPSAPSMARDNA